MFEVSGSYTDADGRHAEVNASASGHLAVLVAGGLMVLAIAAGYGIASGKVWYRQWKLGQS